MKLSRSIMTSAPADDLGRSCSNRARPNLISRSLRPRRTKNRATALHHIRSIWSEGQFNCSIAGLSEPFLTHLKIRFGILDPLFDPRSSGILRRCFDLAAKCFPFQLGFSLPAVDFRFRLILDFLKTPLGIADALRQRLFVGCVSIGHIFLQSFDLFLQRFRFLQ